MNDYLAFLDTKRPLAPACGFEVHVDALNPMLFDWQKELVRWSLWRGRAALLADCGLGKSPMQLEWAKHIHRHTDKPVLIVAPLAVSQQTKREGDKFGVPVHICRKQADVIDGINISNYEMTNHFTPEVFGGLVLDESGILKGFDGTYRQQITAFASVIPYRLACTATPAPNDLIELTTHSEFLGIRSAKEITGEFFRQDGEVSYKFRLRKHAVSDWWRWVASWAVALRSPADLGYPEDGFRLPKLHIEHITVEVDGPQDRLFQPQAITLAEQREVARRSLPQRVAACAELVNADREPWVVWCERNDESETLKKAIPDAVEVTGSDSIEHKEQAILGFIDGRYRVLVSKPKIAGFGLNLQHCARMAFVGLSHSHEKTYQATRRIWRFGQERECRVYYIATEADGSILANLTRKAKEAEEMIENIKSHTNGLGLSATAKREEVAYTEGDWRCADATLLLGDTVKRIEELEDASVGMWIFSPPFPGMYVYSHTPRDMGNSRDIDEMIDHYRYLIPSLLRKTMPGRSCWVHLSQMMSFKSRDGNVGIKDFRGKVIVAMEEGGWDYYGECVIGKDPQYKAIRSKDDTLLFKTLATDAARLRPALNDYLIQFRAPGENRAAIRAGTSEKYGSKHGWVSSEDWIEWASGIWPARSARHPNGVSECEVLNVSRAREDDDERHLCPLQTEVIRRAILLGTNAGELVGTPFLGVGSEVYMALLLNRRGWGCELKPAYHRVAVLNAQRALMERSQGSLESYFEAEDEVTA